MSKIVEYLTQFTGSQLFVVRQKNDCRTKKELKTFIRE